MKWADAKPRYVVCASCLAVKRAYFSIIDLFNVRFGNCRPGSSWIRGMLNWFLSGIEFCKPTIHCGKRHLYISIRNTYFIMYAFDTQSQLSYSGLLYNLWFQQHFLFVFAVPMSKPESNRNCNRTGLWIFSLFVHSVKKWSFIRFVLVCLQEKPVIVE